MKPLRLAQLTDLHFRLHQSGTSDSPRRLSRVVPDVLPGVLASLDVDFLALTGDILDVPDHGREPEAIVADYHWLRSTLEDWGGAWAVVPGNHDDPVAMASVFADQPREWTVNGWRLLAFWDAEGPAHVPVRPDSQLQRFVQALAEPGPQIHLQHYVLHPELHHGWPYNYADFAKLREQVSESRVVAGCLSGHFHDGVKPERRGGCWFATAPAFTHAPHVGWVYTFDGETCTQRAVSAR